MKIIDEVWYSDHDVAYARERGYEIKPMKSFVQNISFRKDLRALINKYNSENYYNHYSESIGVDKDSNNMVIKIYFSDV